MNIPTSKNLIIYFFIFGWLISPVYSAEITLFFVGGQSNATNALSNGIRDRLVEADRWDNPIGVHSNHPGDRISLWYDGAPTGNYETGFKNDSETGILDS